MRRAAFVALLLLARPAFPQEAAGIPIAPVSYAESRVERRAPGRDWENLVEGARLATGEDLRTGPEAVARLELPWMAITAGPGTLLSIPPGRVLSLALAAGRLEIDAEGDFLKVLTPEGEVRGRGAAVVRREPGRTLVMCRRGYARVEARRKAVRLEPGQGALLVAGQPPQAPLPLPEPLELLEPAADPRYVALGLATPVAWRPEGAAGHLQVVSFDGKYVLIQRDLDAAPAEVEIPWPGTFRLRVLRRDANGLESAASAEGLVCMVEK